MLFIYVISMIIILPKTRGALLVTTSDTSITTFLDAVLMQPGQLFINAECGDGRVIRQASVRYGAVAEAYESNLVAWLLARIRCLGKKRQGIQKELLER